MLTNKEVGLFKICTWSLRKDINKIQNALSTLRSKTVNQAKPSAWTWISETVESSIFWHVRGIFLAILFLKSQTIMLLSSCKINYQKDFHCFLHLCNLPYVSGETDRLIGNNKVSLVLVYAMSCANKTSSASL